MTENESSHRVNHDETSDAVVGSEVLPQHVEIDPEDERAVPRALAAMVQAVRYARSAMDVNGIYPAQVAVEAFEDVVAAVARMTTGVGFYAGDWSKQAGKHVGRVTELLDEARAELSSARAQLRLDEPVHRPMSPAAG